MIGFGTYMELPHRHRGSFGVRLVPMMGVALFIPLQCLLSAQNMQAAWGLALFIFLFFMTSAIRVRARVRGRNSRWIRPVGAVVTIVSPIIIFVLGTTTTFVASYSFVPLLPGVIHTLYTLLSTNKSKPRMARLGIQEIIHTALFLFLTIFSYVSNLP